MLIGCYVLIECNVLVCDHYAKLGFESIGEIGEGEDVMFWWLDIENY